MANHTANRRKTISSLIARAVAICCGYTLWYLFSQSALIEQTLTLPITWYDLPEDKQIISPDQVEIRIAATRQQTARIRSWLSCAYVSGQDLHDGQQELLITQDNFFVPHDLKLIHCSPSILSVTVQDKKA